MKKILNIISQQGNANHLTPVRMTVIKKMKHNSGKIVDKKKSLHTIGDNSNQQSHYRVSSKKVEVKIPYDPAISIQNLYSKEAKSTYERNLLIPMFITALFT